MKVIINEDALYAFVESVNVVNVDDLKDFIMKFGEVVKEEKEDKKALTNKHGSYYREFYTSYKQYAASKLFTVSHNSVEGKSMNEIIDKLLKIQEVGNNYDKALAAWQVILVNMVHMNEFLQSQSFRLATFNKYLSEIILKLQKIAKGETEQTSKRDNRGGKYAKRSQ